MSHSEIETLLGAYALDAVDPSEARLVEEHLLECPRCRAEVAAHREVAALLGNVGGETPGHLWERIAGEIEAEDATDREGPGLPLPLLSVLRGDSAGPPPAVPAPVSVPRRSWRRAPLAIASLAAALAVVVGLLSAKVVDLNHQVSGVQAALLRNGVAQEAYAARTVAHGTVQLTSVTAGGPHARILVLPDGEGYWVGRLARLASNRTYQLWALVGHRLVSVGILGPAPDYAAVHVEPDMKVFMVTAEPEGGTVQPTGPVLARGTLS